MAAADSDLEVVSETGDQMLRADSIRSVDSTLVSPTLLRGVPMRLTVRHFGRLWTSPAGSLRTHAMSKATDGIKYFLSHSWLTAGWLKTTAIMYIFNVNAALILSGLTHLVVRVLIHLLDTFPKSGLPLMSFPNGTSKIMVSSELYYLPACIVFLLVFIFGAEIWHGKYEVLCFLDKCCINQTEAAMKLATIRQLGGFLRNSEHMLILWNEEYFTRLWCVYEVAAFCYVNGDARRIVFAPLKIFTCTLALYVFHCFASLGFSILGSLIIQSDWHTGWIIETIPAPFQPLYSWVVIFVSMFFVYLVPSFGLWLFSKLHMEDRRLLLKQLRTFKVSNAQCYLEDDRQFVEEQITLWFNNTQAFEHYVQTVVYDMVANLLQAQGPLPYRMVLVGSLSHLYLNFDFCIAVWQTGPRIAFWRWFMLSVLMYFCIDAIAISVILRLADTSPWPTIWERAAWTQKLKGPVVSAFFFAALIATSTFICMPTWHLAIALTIFAVVLFGTWILYGGASHMAVLFRNDPIQTNGVMAESTQHQLETAERDAERFEKNRIPETLGAAGIDACEKSPGAGGQLTGPKTMDLYI